MSSSAFADEQPSVSKTSPTLTSIDVIHDDNPYFYVSRGEVENFTVKQETKEGHFRFYGYWHITEDKLPTNLEFFLYEGRETTHYKVEVYKKVQLEEVEQEGFEDVDQGQHPAFGEDEECPGCRIILFPEYMIQIFFKIIETTPVTQKITQETISVTQETSQEESDDLVTKILKDMNR